MQEETVIELLKKMSDDLHFIRRQITRLSRASYRDDLDKVASTPERREIWRLCDGTLSAEEIARIIGITSRSVQYFQKDAEKADLIEFIKRGYPKRSENYNEIPSEWKPYKKTCSTQGEQEDTSKEVVQ